MQPLMSPATVLPVLATELKFSPRRASERLSLFSVRQLPHRIAHSEGPGIQSLELKAALVRSNVKEDSTGFLNCFASLHPRRLSVNTVWPFIPVPALSVPLMIDLRGWKAPVVR